MSETTSTGCGGGCACHGGGAKAAATPEVKSSAKASKSGIQNGKGSAPRNISRKFRKNYEGIHWTRAGSLKPGERMVKIYK